MPLKSIQLTLSNDSSISVRSSPGHPPVLQKCTYSGPPGNLLLEGGSTTVKLQCEDAAHGGSAFLTYFLGDFKKTLVLWLCMAPEAGPEIKFNIFDEYPKLDHDVLKKVAQGGIMLETVGFGKEILWQFKDNEGQMHEISMVVDIVSTGHQSEAQLNIREPNKPSVDISRQLYKLTATAALEILGLDRVHEDMAICSLISAGVDGFDKTTTCDSILGKGGAVAAPASWEFIRGVLWNDDPGCDYFYNFVFNNGSIQPWDGPWTSKFNTPGTITYRSHNDDLQFLHAMASKPDEAATETLRKVMLWLEVMYKLSVGDGIQEADQIDSTLLKEFFTDTTTPKGSETLRALLVGTTPNARDTNITRRALGSCFHLIQDSYAVGHCQRELDNPEDMMDVEYTNYSLPDQRKPMDEKIYIKGFPKDKPGRFSSIKTFHCFHGQDGDRHGYYDGIPNGEKLDPSDPTSFYCQVGAANALEQCTSLAQAWLGKLPWEDSESKEGVKTMMERTFQLASDATPSDAEVDKHFWT